MALPTSGKISIKDIFTEMRQPNRNYVGLNLLAAEWFEITGDIIFNKKEHRLSDWYGKIWPFPKEFLMSEKNFRSTNYKDALSSLCYNKPVTTYVKRWHLGPGKYPTVGNGKIYTNSNLSAFSYLLHTDRVTWKEYYLTKDGPVIQVSTRGDIALVHYCLSIDELSIRPTQIDNVPLTGEQYSILVTSNGPWSARITSGASDSSISSASGNGNGTFRLRVNAETKLISELKLISGQVVVTSGSKSVTLRWIRTGLILQ